MGPTDVVFKCYFADGSYKSMLINESDNTGKVVQTIMEKVTFPKTKGLMLFYVHRDSSGEVYTEIAENEHPGQIFKKWDSDKSMMNFKMVFKRKKDAFKWKEDELVSISATSNAPPPSVTVSHTPQNASANAKPPSRPPPSPTSVPNGADEGVRHPAPPPRPSAANPIMAELSLKRAAQDKVLLRQVPRKEQSQMAIIQWVNKKLEEGGKDSRIENLESDLKDGTVLAVLLECLSGLAIKDFNRNPQTKIHTVENHNIIIRYLKVLGVNLVNITGEDLWESRPETMMRIMGIIIKHFTESNPKARLSAIAGQQQQQQQGGASPIRRPPVPVRAHNGDTTAEVPPPLADPNLKPPPMRKMPAKPSAGFVPKPPPAVAKPITHTPPTESAGVSAPAPQPMKRPAVKPPPRVPAQNGNHPVASPPQQQTPPQQPPRMAKPAPPPPTQARGKPALPPRAHNSPAPSNAAADLPPPPPPISNMPLPPMPYDLPPPPPPPASSVDLDHIVSPSRLPPPPMPISEPYNDEYDTTTTAPPPPLPSTLPSTLPPSPPRKLSKPPAPAARSIVPPPAPVAEPEPEPEPEHHYEEEYNNNTTTTDYTDATQADYQDTTYDYVQDDNAALDKPVDELTFEDLESIINNNTLTFEDLLKEHNLEMPNESSYDMGNDQAGGDGAKDNDLDDLLDRLARGEV
ncbi:hypothetical protein SAMD00019534_104180 [Acytostelium subglobosum LB1]|uniref:hypothetical protein n=1 Tax=Acytostelium subglobosum LB1 TaxID=1410327 RepID=UPI000644FC6B|nr:hypothetical protein SAMD00019534_104180 [Acytostelium subglobosum LB1]GAM27243.1 hypothetical protein SAMD00019534_104180 [Acytostelium subglobosum LB1]|eukprot:XP_012749710.1 hypothetical protein SAMD00019534_104180 [Acytostelium subglobosum LB1]